MTKRILITGGAGCLGSNLIDRYLPQGHQILVIDNFATGKRGNLPALPSLTIVEGSVADSELVERAFADFRPTHVIHSAASYKDPADWTEDSASNVQGSINVAKAAKEQDVARLINFQTALCYGRPKQVPIPANHPVQPFTSYGISKTAGEQYMLAADLPVTSFRLANICAPRLAIGPIPTFYKRLKNGQSCFCSETVRDFLDIEDFYSLMDMALAENAPRGLFNVSTGQGYSIKDVFDVVADYLGLGPQDVPVVPPGEDDVPAVVLDASGTEAAFGWRARIGFKETIHRMLRWYDQHGVTDVYSHLAAPVAEKRA